MWGSNGQSTKLLRLVLTPSVLSITELHTLTYSRRKTTHFLYRRSQQVYKEIVIGLNPNRGKSKNNDYDEILLKAKNKVIYIYT